MTPRIWYILPIVLLLGCNSGTQQSDPEQVRESPKTVAVPAFNADSAYYFIEKQVHFGPRVPNTSAHQMAGNFFVNKLQQYGATVTEQEFNATTFDGTDVKLRNIIGTYFPEKQKRVLLAAHWDSRPFADKDAKEQTKPIDAANDGASGVGILLEIARLLKSSANKPSIGIDILLLDGEDWGEKDGLGPLPTPESLDSWWCLGSQYWSKNKHKPGYSAYYGILLDMVGGKNATFYQEGVSMHFAPSVVNKVWDMADQLGYSRYFIKKEQGAITDDHTFINEYAKIPTIDIVSHDPETGGFGDFHHTHDDNLALIDKQTLLAVGNTLIHIIYYE